MDGTADVWRYLSGYTWALQGTWVCVRESTLLVTTVAFRVNSVGRWSRYQRGLCAAERA